MLREIYINRVSLFLTYILAILSLYELWGKINNLTRNILLSSLILFGLVLIISFPFILRYFYNPHVFSLFRLSPPDSFITTHSKHEVNIDNNGDAIVISTREMIFLKNPKKWELFDTIFVHRGLSKEYFRWESADGEEISRVWVGKDMLVIFWRPQKDREIKPKQPYIHCYSWNLKDCYNDPANHWIAFPSSETGSYTLKVKTTKSIEKSVGFALTWRKYYILKKKQYLLYDYARKLKETGCPAPIISEDKNSLIWTLQDITGNKVYACIFYHENAYKWIDKLLR